MIRYLEGKIGIGKLELDEINVDRYDDTIEFDDAMYKLFKVQFRSEKSKPGTYKDLVKLYVGSIKNVIGSVKLIIASKTTRKQLVTYSVDNDVLEFHKTLDEHTNPKHLNYDDKFIKPH
jgi:hypothetical protein